MRSLAIRTAALLVAAGLGACGGGGSHRDATAGRSKSGGAVLYQAQRTVTRFVRSGTRASCDSWMERRQAPVCRRTVAELAPLRRHHGAVIGGLRYRVSEVRGSDRRVDVSVGTPNPTPGAPFLLPHTFLAVRTGAGWRIAAASPNAWTVVRHG